MLRSKGNSSPNAKPGSNLRPTCNATENQLDFDRLFDNRWNICERSIKRCPNKAGASGLLLRRSCGRALKNKRITFKHGWKGGRSEGARLEPCVVMTGVRSWFKYLSYSKSDGVSLSYARGTMEMNGLIRLTSRYTHRHRTGRTQRHVHFITAAVFIESSGKFTPAQGGSIKSPVNWTSPTQRDKRSFISTVHRNDSQ